MKRSQILIGTPWERQPTESAEAFEAFVVYRTMGLERTQAKVAAQLHKSDTLMGRWAAAHRWVERARLFDNECDKAVQKADAAERKKRAQRIITAGQVLQSRGLEALLHMASTKLDASGKQRSLLGPSEIVRLIKAGVDIEKIALGDPRDAEIDRLEVIITETPAPQLPAGK